MYPAPIVLDKFPLPQNNLAVTSYRSESSNVSLVVLDKLLFSILETSFFERLENYDRHTDEYRQGLPIKSPHRRLKT